MSNELRDGELGPTNELTVEELIKVRTSIRNLVDSSGWAYLKSRMVEIANEHITFLTRGGLSVEEYARHGARVELIGELMELPDKDLKDYAFLDEPPSEVDDDGGENFNCPVEPLDL